MRPVPHPGKAWITVKKIFGNDAIHMLPLPGGFIIANKQCEYPDHIVVTYKMATLETNVLNAVTRNVYQLAKFGNNFKQFEQILKDYLNCKTLQLPGGKLFSVYPDGKAAIYSSSAEPVWEGYLKYKDLGPADVVRQGDLLWASFPESNALIRYNLNTMREELRVGGGEHSAFSFPTGLWIEGDKLLCCNTDANRILEMDLSTFSVYDYAEFEEPVKQYIRVADTEIVLLESGVYTL